MDSAKFLDKIIEAVSDKLCNNTDFLATCLEKASNSIDTEAIHNSVVENLVDNIDADEIKDSVVENLNQEIDSDSISEQVIEEIVSNQIDLDDVNEMIVSKFLRNTSIRNELVERFANHLIENDPEFKGQVIEYVGDKLFNHLMAGDPDLIKVNKVPGVDSINKALISGELDIGTSGLPVEKEYVSPV